MKVEISEESYQFLKELACRIATQDNRATAKPYFFVVMKPRWHPCHEDYSGGGNDTKYVRLDRSVDDPDEYEDDADGKLKFAESYRERAEDPVTDEKINELWDNLEQVRMEERDEEDNAFLTFAAYEEHVRLNKHNLGKHHSYLKHAYRNPEMDSLFKAIAEFKDL